MGRQSLGGPSMIHLIDFISSCSAAGRVSAWAQTFCPFKEQCCGLVQSYYGGLLCVAWSHDGRYIATGGEDDLISIYGVLERSVVVWGQGHTSWVAAVAFDTE